ncbi:MAG: electron transport complex subunit E [Gammaproteobacteria bacterium]|nr:electron transport complex subunit E [Gammaproteobacteria bacterium]MBT8110305.1 electron transport complex subunit E [Gammaproteobacteria bacterium]NND48249.1 electron transport complex subunit E [Woeseiaceae bacterium]NNL45008.1 electron transport complex subunit E [Woeseiaceae bacterium]
MALKQVSPTDEFIKGLWRDNPVFIQVLGMCPALAVSNTAINALAMGLATTFVLLMAGLSVSLLRSFIPREARIVSYICIIATFVTCVDYAIMAISIELHRALGAFIALIVVNCLILGRAEAFASKNNPGRALLDGLGMGVGFTFALFFIGVVREILGSGTLFGVDMFPDGFQTWTVMVLPSGGFFAMAMWLLVVNWIRQREGGAEKQANERSREVAS